MSDFTQCESCVYFSEDEEGCAVSFDEDEISSFYGDKKPTCPYYRFYDEYKMVRKQN